MRIAQPPRPESTSCGVMLSSPEMSEGKLVLDLRAAIACKKAAREITNYDEVLPTFFLPTIREIPHAERLDKRELKSVLSTDDMLKELGDRVQFLELCQVANIAELWEKHKILLGWVHVEVDEELDFYSPDLGLIH